MVVPFCCLDKIAYFTSPCPEKVTEIVCFILRSHTILRKIAVFSLGLATIVLSKHKVDAHMVCPEPGY